MRTPLSVRRLLFGKGRNHRPSQSTDVAAELDKAQRQLQSAKLQIEQLRQEAADRTEELEALRRVGEATGSAFDLEEILKVTAEVAIRVTATDSCQVYLYDRVHDDLVLRAADTTGQEMIGKIRLKLGEGVTGWAARQRKHVAVVRGAKRDHRFKFFQELKEDSFESILSVPLVFNNELIGVVNVRTLAPREYTKSEVRLLSSIASQVAGAIVKARRTRQLERAASHLHNLSEVSQAITSNMYIDEMLRMFVEMVARTMGFSVCTVMLLDHERKKLSIKATQSDRAEYTDKPSLEVGDSVAGQAVIENRVITVRDVRQHPNYKFADVAAQVGLCSMAAVPLVFKGEVMGVLNCYTSKPHEFNQEELATLQALGVQAALAIQATKLTVRSAVIQEMHHRVKNNLQQIASLVRLQARFSRFMTVEEALNDTFSRIMAIAAVHELLLREDLEHVSVNQVAEQILTATKLSVVAPGKTVRSEVTGPEVLLTLKQATNLALVLNELVQNAVEHGFADRDEGRIRVDLQEVGGLVSVEVVNDGRPLPDGFDPTKGDRLGLRIVTDLVTAGLGGTFDMRNGDGIVATVRFPREDE